MDYTSRSKSTKTDPTLLLERMRIRGVRAKFRSSDTDGKPLARRCLLWPTIHHTGYGFIKVDSRKALVHRVAYHFLVDSTFPIWRGETKLDLDHKCRMRHCFEPTHLEPVSRRKNVTLGLISKLNTGKSSKFVGVSWSKTRRKWIAHITIEGKVYHLGSFSNEADAGRAYKMKLLDMRKPLKRKVAR